MAIKPVSGEIKAQVLNDNFSALDSNLANLSIGPFDTYTNLSALQSDYPNGRNGFAVVLESDGETGYMYTWTGTTWKKGGLAQAMGIAAGAIGEIEIKENAVTLSRTNFLEEGNNIFDGMYHSMSLSGSPADGGFWLQEIVGAISAVVSVRRNQKYTVSTTGKTDRFRIAGFTDYPKKGSKGRALFFGTNNSMSPSTTIDVLDSNYLVVYLKSADSEVQPSDLMVTPGSKKLAYEPFGVKPILSNDIISADKIDGGLKIGYHAGLHSSLNIDTKKQVIETKTDGSFINCGKNVYYFNNQMLSYKDFPTLSFWILFDPKTRDVSLCSIAELINNRNYVLIGFIRKSSMINIFGNHTINASLIKQLTVDEFNDISTPRDKKIKMPNVSTRYTNESDVIDDWNSSIIYQSYDSLVDNEVFKKSLAFVDESGLNAYRYDFKPAKTNGFSKTKIIFCAPHGHEIQSQKGLFNFIQDLINRKDDDLISALYWNSEITVIPTINPWGVDNKKRVNFRGVDLNRNFPSGWILEGEGTINYSGPEPLSEAGSQYLYNIMTTENYDIAIDVHNYNNDVADGGPVWYGCNVPDSKQALANASGECRDILYHKYNYDSNKSETSVTTTVESGIANEWVATGSVGILCEMVSNIENNAKNGQQYNAECIAALIKNLINTAF